ncbi:MAG TPA: SCO family protein [Candidatus Baltobacteraceae bacterium]|nr:SCO family protein [Candidatus Baltobacteraceae bacterium]
MRFTFALCSALVALALAACSRPQPHFIGSALTPKPAYDFTLADQHGHAFRLSSERGKAVILFFGYTHCPDVCPATMASLRRAYDDLTPAQRANVQVVFVTVDPERDGPRALGRFIDTFDPSFVGLTGTEAQLAPIERAYHVFHQRIPGTRADGGYLVAHTGAVYLIGPGGDLRVMHGWQDPPRTISADVAALLS